MLHVIRNPSLTDHNQLIQNIRNIELSPFFYRKEGTKA